MMTHIKPKALWQAVKLIKDSGKKVLWDIDQPYLAADWYDHFAPVLFTYDDNKLKCMSYLKKGDLVIVDLNDKDITEKSPKKLKVEIGDNLRQLEFDF